MKGRMGESEQRRKLLCTVGTICFNTERRRGLKRRIRDEKGGEMTVVIPDRKSVDPGISGKGFQRINSFLATFQTGNE